MTTTTTASSGRALSSGKHSRGEWDTRVSASRNPVRRVLWDWLSYKRALVDRLAGRLRPGSLVLDLGCGKGAYTHWLLGRRPCAVVSLDWSWEGLRAVRPPRSGSVWRVCADAAALPLKQETFDGLISVDALGHFPDPDAALDEALRVAKPGALLAVHSECSDYRRRWPDKALIRRLGRDMPAEADLHVNLRESSEIHRMLARRFTVKAFFSPAGYLGWLLGYPEKYLPAFRAARLCLPLLLASVAALVKRAPVVGTALRFFNAFTNHLEVYFGLAGGGSCFAELEKPAAGESSDEGPAAYTARAI